MDKLCMTVLGFAGVFILIKVCMKKRRACRRNRERITQIPQIVNQNPVHFVNQQSDIDEAISFHENELKKLRRPHQKIQAFEQEY